LQHENCSLASLDRSVDNRPQVIKKREFALWQSNNNAGQSCAERFTRCNKAVRIAYDTGEGAIF
jgi:hypothetical protein